MTDEKQLIPPITESMQVKMDGVIESLSDGMFKRDAAIFNGISEPTYHRWCKWYPEFREKCEKAILEYKRKIIQTVNINAVKSGKVGLEILRTRWPKEWNVPKKVQFTDPDNEFQRLMRILTGQALPDDIPDQGGENGVNDKELPELSSDNQN